MGKFDQLSREEARQLRAAIDDRLEMLAKLRKSAQARGISTDEIDEAIFILEGADGKGGLRYHLTHQLELLNEAAATDPLFREPEAVVDDEPEEEGGDAEADEDAAWIEDEDPEQAGELVEEGKPLPPTADAEDSSRGGSEELSTGPVTVEVPFAAARLTEEAEMDVALRAMLPAELPKVATDQVLEDIVRRHWGGDEIPWDTEGTVFYAHKRADGTVALCYGDASDGFPIEWWYGLPEPDVDINDHQPTLSGAELLARIRKVADIATPEEKALVVTPGLRVEVRGEQRLYRVAEVRGDFVLLHYYKTSSGMRAVVGAVPRRGLKPNPNNRGYWSPGPFLTPEELERELARAAAAAPPDPPSNVEIEEDDETVPGPENVCVNCFVEFVDGACPECGALQYPEPMEAEAGAAVE